MNKRQLTRIKVRLTNHGWRITLHRPYRAVSQSSLRRFRRVFGLKYLPIGDLVWRDHAWHEELERFDTSRLP